MAIFDSAIQKPPSKAWRYVFTAIAALVIAAIVLWILWLFLLRFRAEKEVAGHFLDAVVAGDTQEAYHIWKPSPSYSYKDFLEDWGSKGYYGPVESYRIESAHQTTDSSGVMVTIEISPNKPFPDDKDAAEQSKTKEVKLWVQLKDHSLSFPPPM